MNTISIYLLKALRKLYGKAFRIPEKPVLTYEKNPEKASRMISELLLNDKPCMIARFGSTELATITNYIGVINKRKNILKYIQGIEPEWWWNPNIMEQMQKWSGFFPPTQQNIERFCQMIINDTQDVDLLGCWIKGESILINKLANAQFIHLRFLEPFWSSSPWTQTLKNKKVLVIHPFAKLIEEQYKNKRTCIFENSQILPEFELQTIPAVQSLGGEHSKFQNWFEALEWMKDEIYKLNYDICLIGCGAYGFPLAAHVKRMGKKAVHLGGALQLLFGIRGKRWEDPNYGVKAWGIPYGSYTSLINDFWVRPGEANKPRNADQVEGACYW